MKLCLAARVGAASAAAWLSACAVGPDFQQPAAPHVERYTATALPATTAHAQVPGGEPQRLVPGQLVPWQWWTMFGSARLNEIVDLALRANPDIQAAEAALRAANEAALAQRAVLLPSVDAHLTSTRQSIAGSTASPQASGASIYTLHTAQLNIGYTPDLFGGNRRLVESAQAQTDVQRFQREAAYIALTANVVAAAVQEASLRAQLEKTRELISIAERQLDMVQRQRKAGVAGASDVAAQEALVAQTRAALPPLEKQFAQARNQLSALTGRLPAEAADQPDFALDALTLPADLPLSLPARLVELRPDIQAAQAQLHVARAQVGVAAAARLPNITLTANTGSSAEAFADLFKRGAGFWGLAADIAQPVFNAGALAHRERAAHAAYEQAEAQYRSTVLVAFQNVADALHAIDADAHALDAAAQSQAAAARSLDIAQRQWRAGVIGFPVVLAAQQAHAQASIALVQARAARLTDSVALCLALGGGWWDRPKEGGNV